MIITPLALGFGLLLGPMVGTPVDLEPFVVASGLFTLVLIPVALTPMPQPQSVAHVNDRVTAGEILESTRTLLLVYGIGAAFGPMIAGALMDYFGASALPVVSASVLTLLAVLGVQQVPTKAAVPPGAQIVYVSLVRTSHVAVDMLPDATSPPNEKNPTRR